MSDKYRDEFSKVTFGGKEFVIKSYSDDVPFIFTIMDLACIIFSTLSIRELLWLSLVCQQFRKISRSAKCWNLYHQTHPCISFAFEEQNHLHSIKKCILSSTQLGYCRYCGGILIRGKGNCRICGNDEY